MSASPSRPHRRLAVVCLLAGAAICLLLAAPASAYNYVTTSDGLDWGVQDAAPPRVDTGSIRDTTDNSLRGFGGLRVRVSTNPLRNEALMRGFNLKFLPPNRFESRNAVNLGGVAVWRSIYFNRNQNWGRWLDFFRNTTDEPIEVNAMFGGQTGLGSASGAENAPVAETSSGDAEVTSADSWALTRTGTAPNPSQNGPAAVVFGSPAPFDGALTRFGSFLYRPFETEPPPTGHESNYMGYQHSFTLEPGETVTLAHFVVIGPGESAPTAGESVAEVRDRAADLAAEPSFGLLTKPELCALVNWDLDEIDVVAFDPDECDQVGAPPMPEIAPENPHVTTVDYDVVGKTIQELRADMEAGVTTSKEITQAYLDRIAAYDVGPWGFNSYTYVARDALEQAEAADLARANGDHRPLLGIPVVIKDLFDTYDMPTTNGSLVFEGYRPPEDATQVRLLREAGAVIIGKASMEEYAQSGYYSDSAFGQVWNGFDISKSSIASSGGTATAIAASLAAAGLGSQTGDSLYGPASAASQWTLRGTDGLASSYGVWPLTWLQDYPGVIARSAADLADMLNATTGTDPLDPITVEADADAHRPDDWRDYLDPNALQGKRIGYYESAFVDPRGTTGTVSAQKAALQFFEEAGAELVEISGGPSLVGYNGLGDRNYTGWQFWIDAHPNSPYSDPREIIASQKRLPYRRSSGYTGTGMMSDAQIAEYKARRAQAKQQVADWLDNPPNPVVPGTATPSPGPLDAVVFPGLRSVVSLNDGGSAAFGRGDPPTNGAGAPSIAFPAGVNDHGEPVNLQLVGRAWDDAKLLSYAYAFDQVANGHIESEAAPPLEYVPTAATGQVRFVGGKVLRLKGRRVRVAVRCAKADECPTVIRLRGAGKLLAAQEAQLAKGRTAVRLELARSAAQLVKRKGKVRAKLLATVTGPSGKTKATRGVTVVAGKR